MMEGRRVPLPWLLALVSVFALMCLRPCFGLLADDQTPDVAHAESGHKSGDKLHTLLDIRKILIKEQEERIEQDDDFEDGHPISSKEKRSSVSWLLAAAIRMCKDYPEQCLRQRRLQENYLPSKRVTRSIVLPRPLAKKGQKHFR